MNPTRPKQKQNKMKKGPTRAGKNAPGSSSTSRVTAPSAVGTLVGPRALPRWETRTGFMRVTHTEHIALITASPVAGNYLAEGCYVNPGMDTFPWLSHIAGLFETYKFHRLEYVYTPMCTTLTGGMVLLGHDFDAADSGPVGMSEFMAMRDSSHATPWQPFSLRVNLTEGDRSRSRYTRSTALAANLDVKTYDVGNLWYGSVGCPASAPLGVIEVRYEIDLYTPQPYTAIGAGAFTLGGSAISYDSTGLTTSDLIGTAPTVAKPLNFPLTAVLREGLRYWRAIRDFEGLISHSVNGSDLDGLFTTPDITHLKAGSSIHERARSAVDSGRLLSSWVTSLKQGDLIRFELAPIPGRTKRNGALVSEVLLDVGTAQLEYWPLYAGDQPARPASLTSCLSVRRNPPSDSFISLPTTINASPLRA